MSAAGTCAESCCGPLKVVCTSCPSMKTRDSGVNLSPETSSAKSLVRAKTFEGETALTVSGGGGVGVRAASRAVRVRRAARRGRVAAEEHAEQHDERDEREHERGYRLVAFRRCFAFEESHENLARAPFNSLRRAAVRRSCAFRLRRGAA